MPHVAAVAMEAAEHGLVLVRPQAGAAITVAVQMHDDTAIAEVRDSGPGLRP